jgi:putative transposase
MIRTEEEKSCQQSQKASQEGQTGSRNKNKTEVTLNPKLQRIQKLLQSFLNTLRSTIHLTYLVLDGHFGNHPAFHMVRQCQLHLISKLSYDAA